MLRRSIKKKEKSTSGGWPSLRRRRPALGGAIIQLRLGRDDLASLGRGVGRLGFGHARCLDGLVQARPVAQDQAEFPPRPGRITMGLEHIISRLHDIIWDARAYAMLRGTAPGVRAVAVRDEQADHKVAGPHDKAQRARCAVGQSRVRVQHGNTVGYSNEKNPNNGEA
jgi:hypothetical protein